MKLSNSSGSKECPRMTRASDSVVILSDNDSVVSGGSADLFDSDENSREVVDVNEMLSKEMREENFAFWEDAPIANSRPQVSENASFSEDGQAVLEPSCSKRTYVTKLEGAHKDTKSEVSISPVATPNDSVRARLDDSLYKMQKDNMEGKSSFGRYMQLKKDKLRYQVNVTGRPINAASEIFKGISIFVNGYTDPSALELRNLIQLHGGEYHCYYEYGTTTYVIATSLANVKVQKTRQNEKYVKPEWIVDCVAAGKLLEIDKYILLPTQGKRSIAAAFSKRSDAGETDTDVPILDARHPKFLEEFYARSRLHLISTLAQEMKDWVNTMRDGASPTFSGRAGLKYLASANYVASTSRIIFHIDLDCFFVSVALRDRPDLIGKPVAITHSKGVSAGFSELASVSYAARACGLHNGMIVRDALKLCPNLICLPYLFDDYRAISKAIYTIVARYTLEIRAVSCDEMYVNCTKLFDELHISDPVAFAEHLRAEVRRETGCPASIGIGGSTLIARLATRYAKPDGLRYVPTSEASAFIANEKVKNLPGLGYHTYEKLVNEFGVMDRCSDLQAVPQSELERVLGKKNGEQLYKLCRGQDDGKNFIASSNRKSVSCDINYGIRFTKKSEVAHFLHVIGQELEKKLKQARMVTSSVTLKLMIRSADAPVETEKYLGHGKCDTQNKTAALDHPTGCAQVITMVVLKLFTKLSPVIEDIRGIGVQCGKLALVTDVGYSVTSEAISRMFNMRTKKKEEADQVTAARSEEQQQLPLAHSILPPSFFGESNKTKILQDLLKYLCNEPQEDAVGVITDFLYYLLRDGCLKTLVTTCLILHRKVYSSKMDHGWLFALNFLFDSIDERCRIMYGAPMIRPAIEKNQELENKEASQ